VAGHASIKVGGRVAVYWMSRQSTHSNCENIDYPRLTVELAGFNVQLDTLRQVFMPPPAYMGEGGNMQSGYDVCPFVLVSVSL